MTAKYEKGCKVVITPVKSETSPRNTALELYVGKIGVVTNYYWIQPSGQEIFYLYAVRIEDEEKEVVLYEDELQPYLK